MLKKKVNSIKNSIVSERERDERMYVCATTFCIDASSISIFKQSAKMSGNILGTDLPFVKHTKNPSFPLYTTLLSNSVGESFARSMGNDVRKVFDFPGFP